jgi:hypothetical protein
MDHHHYYYYYYLVLINHQIHQYQYNQQLKEIFEILKQMMLLDIVFVFVFVVF